MGSPMVAFRGRRLPKRPGTRRAAGLVVAALLLGFCHVIALAPAITAAAAELPFPDYNPTTAPQCSGQRAALPVHCGL